MILFHRGWAFQGPTLICLVLFPKKNIKGGNLCYPLLDRSEALFISDQVALIYVQQCTIIWTGPIFHASAVMLLLPIFMIIICWLQNKTRPILSTTHRHYIENFILHNDLYHLAIYVIFQAISLNLTSRHQSVYTSIIIPHILYSRWSMA